MAGQGYKIIAWAALLALFGIAAAYVAEFEHFANTFDANDLVVKSVALGLFTGMLLRWFLKKYSVDAASNIQLWAACLILPTLFSPLIGSWVNRLLSPHHVEMVSYEFFQEKPFAASRLGFIEGEKIEPSGYYIFIVRNGELERLRSKSSRFGNVQRGEVVHLPVKKGLLGYKVVMWKKM